MTTSYIILIVIMTAVLYFTTIKSGMAKDAWHFVTDPDARKLSRHKYPNGNGMSVRDAKELGLIE